MILETGYDEIWVEEDFGSGEERYLIRRYAGDIVEKLQSKHYKRLKLWQFLCKIWGIRRIAFKVLSRKIDAWNADAFDWFLRDWNGIFEKDGRTAAPCTRENKIKLIKTSEKRKDWLFTKVQLPTTFDDKIQEIVKNLLKPFNMSSNGVEVKENPPIAESA